MKYLITLFLFPSLCMGQIDTSYIVFSTKTTVDFYEQPNNSRSGGYIGADQYLIGMAVVKGESTYDTISKNRYWEVIAENGRIGYILAGTQEISENVDSDIIRIFSYKGKASNAKVSYLHPRAKDIIQKQSAIEQANKEYEQMQKIRAAEYEDSLEYAKSKAELEETLARTDSLKDIIYKKHNSKGIVVSDWEWGYESEYSYSPDFSIKLLNPTKKKIKYVWITIGAKDAVGGILTSYGQAHVTLKCIGPIEPLDYGSYDFERVFASKVIDNMYIVQLKMQYFDGTYKVYKP